MFIRGRSHRPFISKPVVKEVAPQEQPLEQPSISEVALQKVEEVMRMVPESIPEEDVEAFLNESGNSCEECPKDEIIDGVLAEEQVEPIGEDEPAPDLYEVPAEDIAFLLDEQQPEE